MKRIILGATAVMVLALGSSAFAISTVSLSSGSYQSGIGGEFTVTPNDNALDAYIASYSSLVNSGGNYFQTFCIEYNEHFNYGSAYDYQISGAAIKGGTSTQDPVSVGTGWLYSQFASGSLANYYYDVTHTGGGVFADRTAAAGALQNAIWWLEGEITADQSANAFITLAATHFGIGTTTPIASPGQEGTGLALNIYLGQSASTFGVYALNLGPFSGQERTAQDQLIYISVPDGGTTLLLLGMALGGVGMLRRKIA